MRQIASVDGQAALSGSGLSKLGSLLRENNAYMNKKTAHILGHYLPPLMSCYWNLVWLLLPSGC